MDIHTLYSFFCQFSPMYGAILVNHEKIQKTPQSAEYKSLFEQLPLQVIHFFKKGIATLWLIMLLKKYTLRCVSRNSNIFTISRRHPIMKHSNVCAVFKEVQLNLRSVGDLEEIPNAGIKPK